MVWYDMVWYGMVWYGMVWYGMVWYGMVWYGMVWYGMVCCCCCCCEGTQHVPAGEIARHALPGQGAREQSAGVTLAGRVPTTSEGGGGAVEWRGGGARVEEGGATCGGYPGALPRLAGGELLVLREAAVVGVEGGGGDLGVGKARPGPRTLRALPEHPAEVAVPRVRPWRGRGRWPVLLAFYGGEGRPGSCCLPAPSHLCSCCGVAASSPVVRARARVGPGGGRAQGREHKSMIMGILLLACCVWFRVLSPGACPCALLTGGRAAQPAGGSRPGPGAWVAAGGRGGSGAMRVRGPWRSRGGAGGPAGGRQWP